MKDPELKEQFVELRATGVSFASIAERLDVSKTTLIAWSKEMQAEVANLQQVHLEALREKHRVGAEHRMQMFSKQLGAIEAELDKRSLEGVPTEKLVNMAIKLGTEMNQFIAPITFQKRVGGLELDPDQMCSIYEWQA
jgi:septation ring formation regulator EzrA